MRQFPEILIAVVAAVISVTAEARELTVSPGELPGRVAGIGNASDNVLVLHGEVNSADLTSLRRLSSSVTVLDMSDLTVIGHSLGAENYYGQTVFADGEIPSFMLSGTNVREVRLPYSVTRIGDSAFAGTPLIEFTMPPVSDLGTGVFSGCTSLAQVDMSVMKCGIIPDNTFAGCSSLNSVLLPAGVIRKIGRRAFAGTAVQSLDLCMVEEIGDYAFASAREIRDISVSASCTVGEGALWGTSALQTVFSGDVSSPLAYALSGIFRLRKSVDSEEIADGAFAGSGIVEVCFTASVRKVGERSFAGASALRKVNVFDCGDNCPEVSENSFEGLDVSSIELIVRSGCEEVWRATPVWGNFRIAPYTSGVDDSLAENVKITVSAEADGITVASSELLDEVTLYSLDGKIMAKMAPSAEKCFVPLDAGYGTVILSAASAGKVKIEKLIE